MPKQLNNVDRSGYRFDEWDKSFDKFPENDVIGLGSNFKIDEYINTHKFMFKRI